jgi:hypothetical protein
MLRPVGHTAFACEKEASDQPRGRDSESIDGVARCECYNPRQQVEHRPHGAASAFSAPAILFRILANTTN